MIGDHQDKITVGRIGSQMFDHLPIRSVDVAKRLIDAREDGDQRNLAILNRLAEIAYLAAESAGNMPHDMPAGINLV